MTATMVVLATASLRDKPAFGMLLLFGACRFTQAPLFVQERPWEDIGWTRSPALDLGSDRTYCLGGHVGRADLHLIPGTRADDRPVAIPALPRARHARKPGRRREAGIPILTSKITVPGVPDWTVPRPRITKLIAGGTRCPLTVVTGPPGAGKTMALALWAAAGSGPVAWVSLDD